MKIVYRETDLKIKGKRDSSECEHKFIAYFNMLTLISEKLGLI